MGAGKYIHRLQLQRPADAQNSVTGAMTRTWAAVTDLWASIEPLSARELMAAQAQQSQVSVRIEIRYRPGVTADMRLVKGATIYDISGVVPDKKTGREYLTLPCSSGGSHG